jgi:hypothetical protein
MTIIDMIVKPYKPVTNSTKSAIENREYSGANAPE